MRMRFRCHCEQRTTSGESVDAAASLNAEQVEDYLDQIEELTHKLSLAESKIKALESSNSSLVCISPFSSHICIRSFL